MGQANSINGFAYQSRKRNVTGRILKYAFYISADGETWSDPVASGSLPDGEELQQVSFKTVKGRFLKLVALSSHLDRPSTVMAEFYALGQQGAVVKPVPPVVDTLAGYRLRLYGFVRAEADLATLTLDLINITSGDVAFLPTIETDIDNPVIQVVHDKTAEVIYTIRINGQPFSPTVFAPGIYTIVVSEPDKGWAQSFKNIKAMPAANGKIAVTLTP
jgi:hypothetical protein